MKNIFSHLTIPITLLLILVTGLQVNAQNSNFNYTIANDVQVTDRILEFDLYLLDTDTGQPFELAAIQAGILVNPGIYNGGTITLAIVPGSSQLNTSQQPTSVIWTQAQNCIKLTPKSPPGAGSGTIISQIAPGTRICRLRITNTNPFTSGSVADLTFNFTTSPYPTKVAQYIGITNTELACNTSNCFSNADNIVLNPSAPTAFNITGGGSYCDGEDGVVIGLDGSEVGVTYTLYKNNVAQTPTVEGTGSPLDFGDQLAGSYKVTGTNVTGTTDMNGEAVITNITPVTPTASVTVQPTCAIPTGTIVVSAPLGAAYQYAVDGGTYQSGTTFTGVAPGNHTVTARLAASPTCISSPTGILTVNAVPSVPPAPTASVTVQPTCAIPTGTIVVTAPLGAAYEYNIDGGTYQTSTTFSGLAPGGHSLRTRLAASPTCISSPTIPLTVDAVPAVPTTPIASVTVQPTCAVPTGTIVVTSPLGAAYQYAVDGGTYQSGTTFTGVAPGNHTVTARLAASPTCISSPTGTLTVNAAPGVPVTPTASVTIQPTCNISTGTIVISSPLGATYEYSLDGGTFQVSTTFTGVDPGDHTLRARLAASPTCISANSNILTVNEQPLIPAAPLIGITTQPTCLVSTGSVVLNGLPAAGWTITRTPGGTTNSGTGTSTTISGLTALTSYTFTVTNLSGCTSVPSASVVTLAQPSTPTAPIVGTITQPTCTVSTGSVALSGLPSGSWVITRTPGGVTTNGTTTSTTITGLPDDGTYTFTVTNSSGCISVSSGNVVINAQPAVPAPPTIGTITQPTCTVNTGSVVLNGLPAGSWTITRLPDGTTFTGTGTSRTITGLAAGSTYIFTVTNSAGCTSGVSAPVAMNIQPLIPSTPVVGPITQPSCTSATGSVVLNGLPSGSWTLTRTPGGTTTGSGISYTVTGLSAGTYTFTVTNASGCTSGATSPVDIDPQPAVPSAPVVGARTQPTCTEETGSVVLSGLPSSGTWTLTRTPGGTTTSGSGTSTTVTGLPAGTFTFTVTNSVGCISVASAAVVINPQPAIPAIPSYTINCSGGAGNAVITITNPTGTGYLYSLDGGAYQSSVTFSNVANATHYITVQNSSGCITIGPNFSVNCGCGNPPTVTLSNSGGSTCGTTAVVVSGNTFGGSATRVTITENGAGSLSPPSATSSPFTFTYTPAAGDAGNTVTITIITDNPSGAPCSPATATYTLTVNAVPGAPMVGTITNPTCSVSTGSVVLSGLPGTGIWTLIRTPGGTTTTGSGTSTSISGLSANTYTFTVTNADGCVSASSSDVLIKTQPATPTPPLVGPITQPNCATSTGSVVLNGLPASGTWTLVRTPGGTTTSGSGTSTTVSSIPQNASYTFTVTSSDGCISGPSGNVVISAQPATPSVPLVGDITQPTCSVSTGSVVLSGLPATGSWTLTRLPDAVTTAGSGTSTTVSGVPTGTHIYTVTNASGCTSSVSSVVKINPPLIVPTAPVVGLTTQPTCSVATGNVILTGLPSSGTWTLVRTPDNVTTTGSGTSTTISGLTTSAYTFRVTNADGCTSAASGNVVINVQPVTPTAPVVGTTTQPTCSVATGSVILSGLPATGTWTLTRSPGPATVTGSGTTRTVTGIPSGTYTYTVTNSDGCTSVPSGVLVIESQPVTPAAPVVGTITQPTCAVSTGSVVLSGLPASGNWTLTRYPDMAIVNNSGTGITISNLGVNTYTFTVTNSDGCTSVASSSVAITAQPGIPTAPVAGTITQPTCAVATGSVVLNGLPPAGWTITRLPGGNTVTGTGTSTTIYNLPEGQYNFTVTNLSGCISGESAPVLINAQPPTPSAPTSTIDCTQGFGKAVITVTSPTGAGYQYSLNGGTYQSSALFSNIANGTYYITVRNSSGCVNTGASFLVSCGCANPPTVTLSSVSGNTCGIAPVTVSGNTFGGSATSVTITENGSGTVSPAGSITTKPFSFTYTPVAGDAGNTVTITVTTDNPLGSPCAPAIATYSLKVNALPAAPAAGTITQPTCNVATGSVVLNGLPSTGTWIVTHVQGGETVPGSGTSTTIPGLASGTHNFTVTNANGCTSVSSANIVINAQPATPTPPVVGTITHPTCNISTGSVILNGLPASGTWVLTRLPAGSTISGTGPSRTVTGINSGSHTFTVRNAAGCTSDESAEVVINVQPETPTPPVIDSIAQPTCTVATGRVYISGLPETGTWTLTRYTEGVTTTGTGTTTVISGLVANTYNFTVRNAVGCTSVVSSSAKVNAQPVTPTRPVVGTITHPTFSVPTGSVVLSGLPSTGTWTITRLPEGVITTGTGTSRTLTGLEPGTYTFTVTNSFGCTSLPTANVVINARPGPPTVFITNPPTICSSGTTDLTLPEVTAGSDENLTFTYWTNAAGTIAFETPAAAPEGIYYIKGTSTAGYSTIKQVTVTADQLPVVDAGPDQELNYVMEANLNAAYLDYGTGIWSLLSGTGIFDDETDTSTIVTGLTIGVNEFRWTVINGVCEPVSDDVKITVNDLIVPTLITPNGDPYNEYFVLRGLEETLGKTELVVFDRRGMQVFRSGNYENDWNGLDNKGNELPDDTYFWVVKSANGKSLSGFVVIRR